MGTKQFKAESKKLLDMMINSIYTHKEIFLREIISNASDALDKRYFRSLTDTSIPDADLEINIEIDKENRTLTITDTGCGMTAEELENNLGTIAKSGSQKFKAETAENENAQNVEIIGQFGVGFYSAFMVSDKVTVVSRAIGSESGAKWQSTGVEGYTVEKCEKDEIGTVITMHIKENAEDEDYDSYLETYRITELVKKYSDYIRYPIKMEVTSHRLKEGSDSEYEDYTEIRTLNSRVPLWKKSKSDITKEEYDEFYKEKFYDFEAPLKVIHTKTEGQSVFSSLLFIPARAPFDYYAKEYEKGLCLYCKGVLITDKCAELLPDYFSFVKGIVDSEDLSLNISREMLQHDRQLKLIAKTVENKIKTELTKMLENDRENYEKFFKAFGMQLKYGVYSNYGMDKDKLKDLLLFVSSLEKKPVTLKEYVDRMKESQNCIYYACGDTVDKVEMLPQTETVKDKGYEILYLTDNVDEFAVKILGEYEGKKFVNISGDKLDLDSDEEKESLKKENESASEVFKTMLESLEGKVVEVRFTNKLKNHPVCLTSEGEISLEMEKILEAMPNDSHIKAKVALEINVSHPIAQKLKTLDNETLAKYAKILYAQGCLIGGISIDNPAELSNLVCELMM